MLFELRRALSISASVTCLQLQITLFSVAIETTSQSFFYPLYTLFYPVYAKILEGSVFYSETDGEGGRTGAGTGVCSSEACVP